MTQALTKSTEQSSHTQAFLVKSFLLFHFDIVKLNCWEERKAQSKTE